MVRRKDLPELICTERKARELHFFAIYFRRVSNRLAAENSTKLGATVEVKIVTFQVIRTNEKVPAQFIRQALI